MTEQEQINQARAELNTYGDKINKINNYKSQLAELRSRMCDIKVMQTDRERISLSKTPNYILEECFDKCAVIEGKIAQNILEMSACCNELVEKINKLDGIYAKVLYKRYVEGKRFEQIAVECSYAYRWARKLHARALLKYAKEDLQRPIEV